MVLCKTKLTMSVENWRCNNDDFQTTAFSLEIEIKTAMEHPKINRDKLLIFNELITQLNSLCDYHEVLKSIDGCSQILFDASERELYRIFLNFESAM